MQLDLSTLEVAYKAVGFDGVAKLTDFPESTIKAALVYGVRRMIQDSCNSEAAKLRGERGLTKDDELPEEDRKTIHDARLGAMKEGTIGQRSARVTTGLSPELSRVLAEHRAKIKAQVDPKAYKAATPAERDKMLADWMLEQPEARRVAWEKMGAELIARDEETAKIAAAF